jgi:hypothetical protein
MAVDVVTEIEIARPGEEVAAFAADPSNATAWYKNIKAVEWETPPPVAIGSKLRFRAQFLGRSGIHIRGSGARSLPPLRDGDCSRAVSDGDDIRMGRRRPGNEENDSPQPR